MTKNNTNWQVYEKYLNVWKIVKCMTQKYEKWRIGMKNDINLWKIQKVQKWGKRPKMDKSLNAV